MSIHFEASVYKGSKYDRIARRMMYYAERGESATATYYENELRGLDKKFAEEGEP